jgi:hypothetical protein
MLNSSADKQKKAVHCDCRHIHFIECFSIVKITARTDNASRRKTLITYLKFDSFHDTERNHSCGRFQISKTGGNMTKNKEKEKTEKI